MKFVRLSTLVVLAGTTASMAQPTLDGKLAGDAAYYGAAKFTQDQPTSFCNNTNVGCIPVGGGVIWGINNSNTLGVPGGSGVLLTPTEQAAAAAVSTGLEVAIPVAQLGTLGANIRITGWVNGGGSDFISNQVIGGFVTDQGNLGGDGNGGFNGLVAIDWTAKAGDQFTSLAVPGSFPSATIAIDGSRDGAYPAPQFVQTNQTQFGDGTAGGIDCPGGGSEIANVSAMFVNADLGAGAQNYLVIFVGGNMECNFNRLNLVIDNGSGTGFNQIPSACLPAADGLDKHVGMKFDVGFAATHFLSYRNGGTPFGIFSDFAQIAPGGSGGFIGGGASATPIVGTGTSCPPSETFATGSEINQLYSRVNRTTGRLDLLITGNLKENAFLHMFIDSQPGGQNQIGMRNVEVGIADGNLGHLRRFGPATMVGDPALKFDAGFEADYWIASHFENGIRQVIDTAIMRTNGKDIVQGGTTQSLDWGCFQGVDSPGEINFNGTNFTDFTNPPAGITLQDGLVDNVFAAYSPRQARLTHDAFIAARGGFVPSPDNVEWTNFVTANPPVAGEIRARFSNSNVLGVTDASAAGAATADAGMEYSISLAELGWTCGPIKLAGFISDSGSARVSNQVIGGSGSATNLGDPRNVDFSAIAGSQFVVVLCPADFNGDGNVSVQDIFDFLTAWFGNAPGSDFNCAGGTSVQDIFDFLGAWFQGGC